MQKPDPLIVRDLVPLEGTGVLQDARASVRVADMLTHTSLGGVRDSLAGKCVLIGAKTQLASALALIELDGIASRLVICPPDFGADRLASVIAQAKVDAIVCDDADKDFGADTPRHLCSAPTPCAASTAPRIRTEWILPTSGTTGAPKLVAHHLDRLLGAIKPSPVRETPMVWATFYDIRRYGGLQIFLRAIANSVTLVLSDADEALVDHMERCRVAGVTHMSGTPSHWRRLLMSPHVGLIDPEYVRLSGEIADRAILENLRVAYPKAKIGHAYASTEAGVGFEVDDEREGFPVAYLDGVNGVEMKVLDGSLRIRSARTAVRYVGRDDISLFDKDGFVDTDDMVALEGDRYVFKGRRAGVINIGGLKVHPEEVENVINTHETVRMSLVKARRNPIIGDLIVAEVVLKEDVGERASALKDEILAQCRAQLERHKVPVTIQFVPSLALVAGGKLARRNA